jgi:hypothetical protein
MAFITQDKVLEALAGLLPTGTDRDKVAAAVASLLDEAVASVKAQVVAEYNDKLDEGYRIIAEEREKDWQTAELGYKQAYDIIADLRARLTRQEEEFQATLVEEYEKAYQMILVERAKNEELETVLYEEFNKRTEAIREYIVEKCDEFLGEMGDEYYELARREVLNDPCMAEHRVAFERVLDVAKDYLSDEDIMLNTGSKVAELEQQVEHLAVTKRQLEAKNMRLMTENSRVHEYLRETKELIEKNILVERNERLEVAGNVQGRGFTANEPKREVILGEVVDSNLTSGNNSDKPKTITEQWQVLAGLAENN